MRLWHKDLLPHLPRQQLLGQHRECAALRGNGWGKPHATVNYVFEHPYAWLYHYHMLVMTEMRNRGYNVDALWLAPSYRGKTVGHDQSEFTVGGGQDYPEHDFLYMSECIANLAGKGIFIDIAA